ncbi:response regulator [Amylibacter sp.]|nr:response regulator [Amylibacter sp.]MDC0607511.1 response regulator [Amylibacter sp.]
MLVEDDTKTRNAVKALLKHQGFHVTTCVDGADAQSALQQNQFDLLLSDYDLGGKINGLNVIDFARQIAPTTKTLIMSGKSLGEETVLEPTGFIEKPVTRDKLIEILC